MILYELNGHIELTSEQKKWVWGYFSKLFLYATNNILLNHFQGEQINALRLEHDCRVNFPKDKDAVSLSFFEGP